MSLKLESTQLLASKLYSRGISQPAPVVSSVEITDSSYNVISASAVSTEGGYIVVNGYGFAKGCTVYVGKIAAVSTTYVSSTKLRIQLASSNTYLSIGTIGSNIVAVINPDNTSAFYLSGVFFSSTPIWLTSSIGSQPAGYSFSTTLSAISDSAVTYAVTGGSLPSGVTLSSSGELSGTATGLNVDTVYSFTVTATDAETQTTVSSFNITFVVGDSYFSNTTLLLNGEIGNGGVTSTWLSDATASNLQLVPGSTTVKSSNFSPFNTTWSNYFGSSNYLTTPSSSAFNLSSGDWTIEGWFYLTSNSDDTRFFSVVNSSSDMYGSYVRSGRVYFGQIGVGEAQFGTVSLNTWNHIAFCRTSTSTVTCYINGISTGTTTTYTLPNVNCTVYIAATPANYALATTNGYISNFRIVKGSAIYTSSFTPSTTPLTAITNTVLLTCQSSRFVDNSTNNFTITRSGSPTVSGVSPFLETDLTTGSGYFNGSSDYLSIANNSAFVLGSGNFTIECWVYLTALSTTNGIYTKRANNGYGDICILLNNANLQITCSTSGSTWAFTDVNIATGAIVGSWFHVAVVRNGTSIYGFINGVPGTSQSVSGALFDSGQASTVGSSNAGSSQFFNGYISNFRFIKGVAAYSGTFNLPTAMPDEGVTDPYFNYTTLLLHGNQPSGVTDTNNNVFKDSSTNVFPITRNGNVTQGTFTPFSQTGWSNYFNGTTDYLNSGTTPTNYLCTASTSGLATTFEVWVFPTSWNNVSGYMNNTIWAKGGTYAAFGLYNGTLQFFVNGGGTVSSSSSVPLNAWSYIAVTINGATVTFYINGVSAGSGTLTGGIPSAGSGTPDYIAYQAGGPSNSWFAGYISNFRISNIVRTISAVPTAAFTSDANTVVLSCQSNRFKDNSANNFTLTVAGTPSVQAFSPFAPTAAYDTSVVGGSGYFDGTGDYLNTPTSSNFVTSGDFTMEAWAYNTGRTNNYQGIIVQRSASGGPGINTTNTGVIEYVFGGTVMATVTMPVNQWFHVAMSRSGSSSNNISMYFNGTRIAQATNTGSTVTNNIAVGRYYTDVDNYYWLGYIASTRYTTSAIYSGATITVPTAPVTAVANTQLLLNYTNAGIYDSASKNVLETVGNAQLSTTQSKWGGSSMYFDGSSDWLAALNNPNLQFGGGNFTVELWLYLTEQNRQQSILNKNDWGTWGQWFLYLSGGNVLSFGASSANSSADVVNGGFGTPTFNAWNHIAVVRSGTAFTGYINGVGTSIGTSALALYNDPYALKIGANVNGSGTPETGTQLNGYIDDLRITKGYARYTAPYFVVPSQPLSITQSAYTSGNTTGTAITGTSTSLLTAQYRQGHNNNGMQDSSNGKLLITSTGTPTQGTFTPFSLGSYSNYFDGSATSVLSITSNSALAFDMEAYTVEAWVYQTKRAVGDALIFSSNKGAETNSFIGYIKANGSLSIEKAFVGAILTSSANDVPLNTWCHIAFVRTSIAANGTKLYVNGIVVATGTDVTNWSGYAAPGIGVMGANADYTMVGNISNLRVVKGTAVYTSAFTPSTIPLTPVTNTVLLTCQSPSFTDNSYLNSTITATGTTSVQNFNPFKALRITPTTYSGYFNGAGDYIYNATGNANLAFGTGDFTVECWVYLTALPNGYGAPISVGTSAAGCWAINCLTSGTGFTFRWDTFTSGAGFAATGVYSIRQWYHVAYVRSGTTLTAYVNGTASATQTNYTENLTVSSNLYIGTAASNPSVRYQPGYISNIRVVKGTAVYTNNFTVPTTPLTTTQGLVTGVPASFSYIATGTTTWTCPVGVTSVDYLVVAGGGGGGSRQHGGGGGGGGYREGTGFAVTAGTQYTIIVGGGGTGGAGPGNSNGTAGSNSVLSTIISNGGGYGGGYNNAGGTGGSGGGGGNQQPGGAGNTPNTSPSQGNTGGAGSTSADAGGGGGGGAFAPGTACVGTYSSSTGGNGGNGTASTISGSSITYAGGGGGGGTSGTNTSPNFGSGGNGGGGAGGGASGTANTGGGGGANSATGGNAGAGGSGIVILRYTGSDLSAIAGNATSLLTLQSNTFTDNSSNALTFTVTGSPKVQTFSPLNPTVDSAPSAYSTSIVGGSMYFNGSSDQVRSTYYNWFSGDATVEGWFYMTSNARYQGLWGGGVDLNGINLQYNETGVGENKLHLFIGTNAGWGTGTTTNTTLYPYTWYHIAYTKTSANLHYLYINGVVDSNINGISNSFTWSGTNFYVGTPMFTNRYFNGYISNLAVHNYRKYTSNFVPSALPLSATTRTTLLLSGTNTAIIDQTGKNDLQTVGDVRLSNSVYKYGNNSMYFDGTGDYLVIPPNPAFRFGSADFTIEAWIYPTYSTSSGYTMGWHNNGTSFSLVTGSTLILLNTWTHIVWSKTGTSMRFFINGVLDSDGVKTVSSIIYNNVTDPLKIGFGVDHTAGSGRDFCHCGETGGSSNKWFAYLASGGTGNFYGYIDDFRITTGYARYTANFTAPGLLLGK